MEKKKSKKQTQEIPDWPRRPGYNYVLGYVDNRPSLKSKGINEVSIDRNVKDGMSLNK